MRTDPNPTMLLTSAQRDTQLVNQQFRCRKDGCDRVALKRDGMLCRPCWIIDDPDRAARVLDEWSQFKGFRGVFQSSWIVRKCADCDKGTRALGEEKCAKCQNRALAQTAEQPRRSPAGEQRKTCTTDGCTKKAYHSNGTLCGLCYVKADPVAHGCPRCHRSKQTLSREDRLCWNCVRRDRRGIEKREGRRLPVCRGMLVDALLSEAAGSDLDDELRVHLGNDASEERGSVDGERECATVD